jgi:hypothetical protein
MQAVCILAFKRRRQSLLSMAEVLNVRGERNILKSLSPSTGLVRELMAAIIASLQG